MNNQVNEVLEKIRDICGLKKLEFGCEVKRFENTPPEYYIGSRGGVPHIQRLDKNGQSESYFDGSFTIIGLPVQLNHLLLAVGKSIKPLSQRTDRVYLNVPESNLCYDFTDHITQEAGGNKYDYNLQKSVEDNLRSNPELTKWVHGVIIGKE